jgi:hypothetical protein
VPVVLENLTPADVADLERRFGATVHIERDQRP